MGANTYFNAVKSLIDEIEKSQMENILRAARLVSDATLDNRLIYLFGAGHSCILSFECYARAGGMGNIQAMIDGGLDFFSGSARQGLFERLPGYAACMIGDYDIREGDVLFVFSNSGRNPAPVQMAIEAKKLGAVVVGVTSLEHSNSVTSNDPSGKKLVDVADLVIDNGCPAGDAMVALEGLLPKVGPGSTVAGATIMNAIIVQAAQNILDSGGTPPVFMSGNLPGGKDYNKQYREANKNLRNRMRHR